MPAPGHQVAHRDPVGRHRGLRQQAEHLGHLAGGQLGHRGAVEQHLARPRLQQPRHAAQQGGLPAGVRAHDGGQPTVEDVDVEPVHDVALGVPETQSAR
jgi:hypothetical protein